MGGKLHSITFITAAQVSGEFIKIRSQNRVMEVGNFGSLADNEEGMVCSLCQRCHSMPAAQQGCGCHRGCHLMEPQLQFKNKGLSERGPYRVRGRKGGQRSGRHRCVGAGASQLCPPSPTPGGLLSTHQHLLIEGLPAESRGANLEAE